MIADYCWCTSERKYEKKNSTTKAFQMQKSAL